MQFDLFDNLSSQTQLGVPTKVCTKCNRELPETAFGKSGGTKWLRPECRDCNNKLAKVRSRLKQSVAPPPEDHICPICKRSAEQVQDKGNKRNPAWVLDHDHDTEAARDWICHSCNRGLGIFNDSVETLQSAIEYLNGHA